jgi:microsomal dipeptidase-like Zn-dependent dipeptidase
VQGANPAPGGNVGTRLDTIYVAIPGIAPKTGHNTDIFRREWWNVQRMDTSKQYVIRITDNATDLEWGHINIDDIRMVKFAPDLNREVNDSLRIQRITIKDLVSGTDQQIWSDYYTPLYGSADTHTHLMSHLAMGRKLLHGAPDIGSIIPAGTRYKGADVFAAECNTADEKATSVEVALGTCNATHGGWGTDNDCGNYLRAAILNHAFDANYIHRVPPEVNLHGDHPHQGYPQLLYWPHYSSASHQQMYVDWIRRAYEGGLRVLVTLTVNSELLGGVLSGDAPLDDKSSAELQLEEIKNFIRRHNDFMELALGGEDMRRIIRSGKMAVILGMEVDNFGNFNYLNVVANETTLKSEVRRLYTKGVRYIFPIHVVNNKLGGSAIYSMLFNLNNQYTNSRPLPWGIPVPPGLMFQVETARDPRINYSLSLSGGVPTAGSMTAAIVGMRGLFEGLSLIPYPPAFDLIKCPQANLGCIDQFRIVSSLLIPDPSWDIYNSIRGGHINKQGLTPLGVIAIKEMMKLGMIIDIDHMSEKSATTMLDMAGDFQYPVMSGHTGMRDGFSEKPGHEISENQRSEIQLETISKLGGMFGVGCSEQTAAGYLMNLRLALRKMGNRAVTMGSDINGFVTMPEPRFAPGANHNRAIYSPNISNNWNHRVNYYNARNPDGLRQYSFGSANRTWDYNTEGVAHIGLYPDFYQDLKNLGMTTNERNVFFGAADYFVNMWEKCERQKTTIR